MDGSSSGTDKSAVTVFHSKSFFAVIPQRIYANCCLTINLAQLTLSDEQPNSSGSANSTTADPKPSSNDILCGEEFKNAALVSNNLKENLSESSDREARMHDEKLIEGPSPKRRKNQTVAE
ncbi:unnamed protein product [Strongylus vulgaris]|uniref:Uncharacterized protein n=1 Tax=Strongylus vulgaris TaxID=40348 RepID=A0A3P7INR1_STRVU|nr:unnamed protein product [Strongylus vulgaris]